MYKIHYNGNIVQTFGRSNLLKVDRLKDRQKKQYFLKYKHYQKISSSAAYAFDNKKYNLVFLTFTIQSNITDNRISNPAFSYLLRLLKKSHGLNSSIWVAERQKRGAIHYHTILDIPFIDYNLLKAIWHKVGLKYGIEISLKNSVSGSKSGNSKIDNPEKAVKYISKYISKGINGKEKQTFQGRCYAISHNINVKPRTIDKNTAQNYIINTFNTFSNEFFTNYLTDSRTVANDWDTAIKDSNELVKEREKLDKPLQLKERLFNAVYTRNVRLSHYYERSLPVLISDVNRVYFFRLEKRLYDKNETHCFAHSTFQNSD